MPRKKLPTWRRILTLDYIAIRHKQEVVVPGWMLLGAALTLPIWVWFLVPFGARQTYQAVLSGVENSRRRPYGGLNIRESHTARRRFWRWRRRSLDGPRTQPAIDQQSVSRLLLLPYELREHIWLYVLRPAPELYIRHDYGRGRLFARVKTQEGPVPGYSDCRDLSQLLKLNRTVYAETSRLLYERNTFCFQARTQQLPGDDFTPALFLAFAHSILPSRVCQLRKLVLRVDASWYYDPEAAVYRMSKRESWKYKEMCRRLKSIGGMQMLRVEIDRCSYQTGNRTGPIRRAVAGRTPENEMLSELVDIRALDFVVEMPWPDGMRGQLDGMPFVMKYRNVPGSAYPTVEP